MDFKQPMQANMATLESSEFENSPDFSFNYLTALLASHYSLNDLGDGTPNESQHFAFAAFNEGTLHYGTMKKDDDRLLFEKDMHHEIADLVSTNSIAVMRRDALPVNIKPVPSIWNFRRKRVPAIGPFSSGRLAYIPMEVNKSRVRTSGKPTLLS
jgi:hypothetical protein